MLGNDRRNEIPSTGGRNGFFVKIQKFILLDKVKNTDIYQFLNIELLCIEQSQLRGYGHVTRMSHERTAKQLMDALSSSKRVRGRPRTDWRNYVEDLPWSLFGIPPEKLPLVAEDQDAWRSQLELLPPHPKRSSGQREIH